MEFLIGILLGDATVFCTLMCCACCRAAGESDEMAARALDERMREDGEG